MFGNGNAEKFAAKNAPKNLASPLSGKTIFWLGSSVTSGLFSYNETMPDYLAIEDGLLFKKDALSGTTLRQKKPHDDSYLSRLLDGKILKKDEAIDAFVCQLSTNDAWDPSFWGVITPEGSDSFNPATTLGAIENIIAYVRKTWHCPLFFYTGAYYEDMNGSSYASLVKQLQLIAQKWRLSVIDLFSNTAFNANLPAPRALLMHDGIHPFRAGYGLWWTPEFEKFFLTHLDSNGRFF